MDVKLFRIVRRNGVTLRDWSDEQDVKTMNLK